MPGQAGERAGIGGVGKTKQELGQSEGPVVSEWIF